MRKGNDHEATPHPLAHRKANDLPTERIINTARQAISPARLAGAAVRSEKATWRILHCCYNPFGMLRTK
jgi:hypothetical protein